MDNEDIEWMANQLVDSHIADDIALIVLRNLRQEGYINEGGGR